MRQLLLLIAMLGVLPALAHEGSTSYLYWQPTELRLDIDAGDLAIYMSADQNLDGVLRWGEVRQAGQAMGAVLNKAVTLTRGGQSCRGDVELLGLTNYEERPYTAWSITWQCPERGDYQLDYSLFFDRDTLHRAVLSAGEGSFHVLSPTASSATLQNRSRVWYWFVGAIFVVFVIGLSVMRYRR